MTLKFNIKVLLDSSSIVNIELDHSQHCSILCFCKMFASVYQFTMYLSDRASVFKASLRGAPGSPQG